MTVREAFWLARQQVGSAETRILFIELFHWRHTELFEHLYDTLSSAQETLFLRVLRQRAEGIPLQYILGHWTFMDREYTVGAGVLIPRDDTEVAVRQALSFLETLAAPKVMDLCAGSGIIALTMAQECPEASVTAIEKEPAALTYLYQNVKRHHADNVTVIQGDIFDCHVQIEDASLDLLVSNPPYIRTDVLPTLQKEVQFEPMTALDGGQDGLQFYRCIAEHWTRKLKPGGGIVLEIGEEQAQAVTDLLSKHDITDIQTLQDIQELDRVIFGTKKR